jgi:hypothetical protein
MEIICSDANFSPEALSFYEKNNTIPPTQDRIYPGIREVIKVAATGETGILLEGLINPPVTFAHPILGRATKEVTWNLKRFRTLSGGEITREMIEEIIKEKIKT